MADRYRIVTLAAANILLLSGCGSEEKPAPVVRPVLVQKIAAPGEAGMIGYSGEIRARYETDLGFRIPGKIVARLVDVGAVVRAGQALARIDPADANLQRNLAEANRTLAEAEAKRYRDLRSRNFVSESALDTKETALKAADAQAGLARNQSDYATLTADHDGIVTAVLGEVGQVVAAGQGVLRLARPQEKEAVISVPEDRLAELRAARSVIVTPWALPTLKLSGRLRELAPAADAATRTYTARISIPHADAAVQLGMTVRVTLPASDNQGILLPAAAVVDQGQGPAVWIVASDKVSRRPIKIRQQREDGVVVDGGVAPGELVVVVGAHKLVADQTVRPVIADAAAGPNP